MRELADHAVAVLRAEAGRDPHNPGLVELVGQLSTGSEEFRTRWPRTTSAITEADPRLCTTPVVGTLTMPYEHLYMAEDSDQYLLVYTPQPGTPAHDSLKLLASWGHAGMDTPMARESLASDRTPVTDAPDQL